MLADANRVTSCYLTEKRREPVSSVLHWSAGSGVGLLTAPARGAGILKERPTAQGIDLWFRASG